MSGTWPVYPCPILCHFLVMFQTSLALFRTSLALIRAALALFQTSIKSFWSYSRHCFLMSGLRPGKTGHVSDINLRCPEHGQCFQVMFRTLLYDEIRPVSKNSKRKTDDRNRGNGVQKRARDIQNMASDVRFRVCDVRNKARNITSMASNPGPIPDIFV